MNKDYKQFVQMAQTGHYPLFFNDWLNDSLNESQSISYVNANKNVKDVFDTLARHRTLDKKRTALIGMDKEQRDAFIRSFFKVVEHEVLKDLKTLH